MGHSRLLVITNKAKERLMSLQPVKFVADMSADEMVKYLLGEGKEPTLRLLETLKVDEEENPFWRLEEYVTVSERLERFNRRSKFGIGAALLCLLASMGLCVYMMIMGPESAKGVVIVLICLVLLAFGIAGMLMSRNSQHRLELGWAESSVRDGRVATLISLERALKIPLAQLVQMSASQRREAAECVLDDLAYQYIKLEYEALGSKRTDVHVLKDAAGYACAAEVVFRNFHQAFKSVGLAYEKWDPYLKGARVRYSHGSAS
jgi:hypothetical protein